MHAGKVIEVKPFCPRHGVPLKHRVHANWHCTQGSCDYYLFLPSLADRSGEAVRFLKNIHGQIENRVRDGEGYIKCPNDPSPHI